MQRRTLLVGALLLVAPFAAFHALKRPYPREDTPEGAYVRVAQAVARDQPREFFAYLEQEAQWACYTTRDARAKAAARIDKSYPEPQRSELLARYAEVARAPDGSDLFAMVYAERGWAKRLRRDMSGAVKTEIEGDRASVVTARGTRWPFRKRANGIWGITVFTAELLADAEKATRDLALVSAAADDYDRAKGN